MLFAARWLDQHKPRRPPKRKPRRRGRQLVHPVLCTPAPIQLPLPELGKPLVIVECIRWGRKVRVRPACPGYDRERFCQFPRALRQPGLRYVAALHLDPRGFYHVSRPITLLREEPFACAAPEREEPFALPAREQGASPHA